MQYRNLNTNTNAYKNTEIQIKLQARKYICKNINTKINANAHTN